MCVCVCVCIFAIYIIFQNIVYLTFCSCTQIIYNYDLVNEDNWTETNLFRSTGL